MHTTALRKRSPAEAAAVPNADAFARELSELCRKHGLAIAGEPELFVMEAPDYKLAYKADDQSRLIFV